MSSFVLLILISQIQGISFSGREYDTVMCLDVILSYIFQDGMDFSREPMKAVNLSYDNSAVLRSVYLYGPFLCTYKYHKAALCNI